ncbi:MAG: dipeptidyl aminopeptidase/acylaminoacyl peptidase [Roseivirga sp.]|jgi:dipeptidyl aminopeptidase/acylaminoacyl peptidase
MTKILSVFSLLLILCVSVNAQKKQLSDLTVKEIMQEPDQFVGASPSRVSWSRDSKSVFFQWNPDGDDLSSFYKMPFSGGTPEEVEDTNEGFPLRFEYNKDKTKILFERSGDIYTMDVKSMEETKITSTVDRESSPAFHDDESIITFVNGNNLFSINTKNGLITQLTNFRIESNKEEQSRSSFTRDGNRDQDKWLSDDQLSTSEILQEQKNRPRRFSGARQRLAQQSQKRKTEFEFDNISGLQLSPDGKYVSFSVRKNAENGAKSTIVPNYVTQSGYTTDINARSKVGGEQSHREIGIYNIEGDSVYILDSKKLNGISDLPDYIKDYPDKSFAKEPRKVSANDILWSKDGKYTVVHFGSNDNKDRWIVRLLPSSGDLIPIDRQRDEAWIAGPGIGSEGFSGVLGMLPDNKTIYYQSEKTGYSHLYLHDLSNGVSTQLTKGKYEVYSPQLSMDNKTWYFTANMKHPGIRHFYSMPVKGGKITQITSEDGHNEVTLSPDEKSLAILYSYIDRPDELYIQDNKAGAAKKQMTESRKDGFKNYTWHKPEVITFKAEDGEMVHARVYKPANSNGAGVIFVHGAGYLQNAHYGWSSYLREYMFNNMLMAQGYTVMDIDYRGSAGYGRDWRTGIYRHMGGKDLSDNIDGAKYMVKELGVDPQKIGMYGGSYGGFITLFAMFNHPDVISSGAALRSVTDWAHYNHGYTANILNTPTEDPKAYKRSSPIYFAEGLQGNLLIAHGMVDTNVHFQDVVRLAQRLIELGKDNWEMALYPVENHGFSTPSSWTDEYKRIFKLFETTLR